MKKKGSIFDTVREIKNNEELKSQKKLERKVEKNREKYGKQNAKDKKEVLKVRQGVIDESEAFAEEEKEKKKYTLKDKIGNFFYHNKWWLGITAFFVFMVTFLVVDRLTLVQSDIGIILTTDVDAVEYCKDGICDYFESLVSDFNKDKRHRVDVAAIPISYDVDKNYKTAIGYENSVTNLSEQLQFSMNMIILGDSAVDSLVEPDDFYEDLEKFFPDCPYIEGNKFYLKDTDFAERIGCDPDDIPDDLYLAVRLPMNNLSDEKTNQKNYDHAMATIKSVVEDLS